MLYILKNKKIITCLVFIALTLGFIFTQSALPSEKSYIVSDSVSNFFENLFTKKTKPPQNDSVDVGDDGNTGTEEEDTGVSDGNADTEQGDTQVPDNDADTDQGNNEVPDNDADTDQGNNEVPGDNTDTDIETDDSGADTDADNGAGTDTGSGNESDTGQDNETDEGSANEEKDAVTDNEVKEPSKFATYFMQNIRKIAHFTEHGIFGLEVFFLAFAIEKLLGKRKKILPLNPITILICLNTGMLVAFIDESIQLLSGRTASIRDIWLDLSGFASFAALCFIITLIVRSIRYLVARGNSVQIS